MIYATVSDELKNKYLKENGITATLMAEEKKEGEPKHFIQVSGFPEQDIKIIREKCLKLYVAK